MQTEKFITLAVWATIAVIVYELFSRITTYASTPAAGAVAQPTIPNSFDLNGLPIISGLPASIAASPYATSSADLENSAINSDSNSLQAIQDFGNLGEVQSLLGGGNV
jgi:hypothetical protein